MNEVPMRVRPMSAVTRSESLTGRTLLVAPADNGEPRAETDRMSSLMASRKAMQQGWQPRWALRHVKGLTGETPRFSAVSGERPSSARSSLLPPRELFPCLQPVRSMDDVPAQRQREKEARASKEFTWEDEERVAEAARLLREQRGVHVEALALEGLSALHVAAREGHIPATRLLIDAGADVDEDSRGGETPLHFAAQGGRHNVVRLLIEAGAEPERANAKGLSPLHVAAGAGTLEVVRLLCEEGADVNRIAPQGATPLHSAALRGHLAVVAFLCNQGADRDKPLQNGMIPEEVAALRGHLEVVRRLQHGRWVT